MKLQDQVCTLEQAKLLKSLGVKQDSLFSWCGDETKRLMDNGKHGLAISDWVYVDSTIPANNQEADHRSMVPSAKPFAAAFTVAELGAMLPTGYDTMRISIKVDATMWQGYDLEGNEFTEEPFKTEAEARAQMLIHLLETNAITVEEVNGRLCAE